ncbi:MAG: hypothetical protein E7104_12935 [Prevotella sp.]|nr:hypothetical protein [Prevotella sp.]
MLSCLTINSLDSMSQFIEMFKGDFHNKVHIKDVCHVVSGKSIPTKLEDIDGNNPYIKVADFNIPGNEKYITVAQRYVSDDSASYSKQIPKGSVIFAKNGAASMSNKKRLTKIRCCIDMNTMAVFPKNDSILPDFLFATIEAMDVSSHVRQGAIPSISPKSIEDSYIAMPTMEEQYRYISIANQADKSGFDGFKSQFIEMFSAIKKVGINTLVDTIWGSSPDSSTYNDTSEGVPFYQGKTEFGDLYINNPVTYCTAPVKMAKKDSILMSVRAPVGAVNIATQDCCIGRGLASITPKKEKGETMFIYYALKYMEEDINRLGTGSTFKAINKDSYARIQLPEATSEGQMKFVEIAKQADKSGSVLQYMIAC